MKKIFLIFLHLSITFICFSCKKDVNHDRINKELFDSEISMHKAIDATTQKLIRIEDIEYEDIFKALPDEDDVLDQDIFKGKEIVVNEKKIKRVMNLLLNRNSYSYNRRSMCIPHYGILVTADDIKFLICLSCNQIVVCDNEAIIGHGLLKNEARNKILSILKGVLPKADDIQKLR